MLYPNVETFIGCDSSYRAASIVLYGAPYDSTTSYRPGARFGPAAIRHESYGLETYSPYQNADLTDFDIFDSGDLELCFGSSESALADIQSRAAEILHDGKFPLLLGGEHLVTLGAVRAMVEKYPDLHIVHFDAHADLRDDYLGAKLSHACAAAMTSSATGASTSSASAAATAPSLSSQLPTPRCTSSISRALPSSPSSSVPARCPFT
jgi:agmatinase